VKHLAATLLATLALSLIAGSASAADLQTCRSESASSDAPGYKRVGREVRKSIAPEVRKYLGAQYTAFWLQPDASTAAQVREVKSLLAELGDRIRVTRVDYPIEDDLG
jgi:hypothetical protein